MSLLKYPGGKEAELKYIIPNAPKIIKQYYEPFVGGGSVFFSITADKYFINDKSDDLIDLYLCVKNQDKDFFDTLEKINYNWMLLTSIVLNDADYFLALYKNYRNQKNNELQLSDEISEYILSHVNDFNGMLSTTFNFYIENFVPEIHKSLLCKMKRMRNIESKKGLLCDKDILDNIECALKSSFYIHFRYIQNHKKELKTSKGFNAAVYLFIRDMCYSSMFRYNGKGDFNVPYGGISYNKKTFDTKLKKYHDPVVLKKLNETIIECDDFYAFLKKYENSKDDFIFVDPPYDTDFSTYAMNKFEKADHERLSNYLINECKGNFMLIIKSSPLIETLYRENVKCRNGHNLIIGRFDKTYQVSFKNRNNRDVQHLIIKNY